MPFFCSLCVSSSVHLHLLYFVVSSSFFIWGVKTLVPFCSPQVISESSGPTDAATIGGGDLQKLAVKMELTKCQCIWLKYLEICWHILMKFMMLKYVYEFYEWDIMRCFRCFSMFLNLILHACIWCSETPTVFWITVALKKLHLCVYEICLWNLWSWNRFMNFMNEI